MRLQVKHSEVNLHHSIFRFLIANCTAYSKIYCDNWFERSSTFLTIVTPSLNTYLLVPRETVCLVARRPPVEQNIKFRAPEERSPILLPVFIVMFTL